MDINEDYQITKAMTHYQCRPLVEEIARLRAELEAARVDAERYRWLRDEWYIRGESFPHLEPEATKEQFDAAIDAARGKDNG